MQMTNALVKTQHKNKFI